MHPRHLCFAWLLAVAAGCGASAATLRITSPLDGTTVSPGATVTVTVEADAGAYRQIVIAAEDPIGFTPMQSSPPYRFTLQIPPKTRARSFHLTALGLVAPGKFDDSENVTIRVEPAAPPLRCRVEPASRIEASVGEEHVLRVLGVYAGGSEIDLTESKWARYQSEAPQIASVSKYGVITAVAPGRTHIRVCGMFMLPVIVGRP